MKVLIEDLDTPSPTIYFIDTRKHETHWWFARAQFGDRFEVDRFARRTYHRVPRPAAALNLVYHADLVVEAGALGHAVRDPITVEIGDDDRMPPDMALRLVKLVQDRMPWTGSDERRLLWLPPDAETERETIATAEAFAAAAVGWLRRDELLAEVHEQLLNPGLAFGTLRRLDKEGLGAAVVSSRDVLLLARVPNELPVAAGVISNVLQTPLSHVAIASRARGTPNVAVPGAFDDPAIAALEGQLVRFEVTDQGWSIAAAERAEAEAFWAEGRGVRLEVPAPDLSVRGLPALDDLGFADSASVGVKAANVAELHQLLGDRAPDGFAVPFAHYDAFVRGNVVRQRLCRDAYADCAAEGRPQAVCERALSRCTAGALAGLSIRDYALRVLEEPAVRDEAPLREAVLDGVRFQMGHAPVDAALAAAIDAEVAARWGSAPIRMRSSTNAEDLPDFSGAGLYRSVSAAAGTGRSPSGRIRKVWASVWTFRAVEERRAWGIAHDRVAMAVLVHPAYRGETANGVVVTADLFAARPDAVTANLAIDDRAVANPAPGDLPEQLVAWREGSGVAIDRRTVASGTQGAPVLDDREVAALYALAVEVRDHFAPLYGRPKRSLAMDLEVKRTASGDLIVKQARPFPLPQVR